MNKRGFTLIELLAVIVILAIIAIVTIPITINVIEGAKEKAFLDTAYNLMDGMKIYAIEKQLNNQNNNLVIKFYNQKPDDPNFKMSGKLPDSGTIHLTKDGLVELKIWSSELKRCAEKNINQDKIIITDTKETDCQIEIIIPRTFQEVMTNNIEVMTNDPDNNLRYVGSNPNNYVLFNNELWRIIGLFDGKPKIIKNELQMDQIWDKNATEGGHGSYGFNDWQQSTLQKTLNTTYLNSIDTISKGYIDVNHNWNLGGISSTKSDWTRKNLYNLERDEIVYEGRPTTWTGAIGLIYPSDYGYSISSTNDLCNTTTMDTWGDEETKKECSDTSWLYNKDNNQWTITPHSEKPYLAYCVFKTGIMGNNLAYNSFTARPTLYLNSNVKIMKGKGTETDPFTLGI